MLRFSWRYLQLGWYWWKEVAAVRDLIVTLGIPAIPFLVVITAFHAYGPWLFLAGFGLWGGLFMCTLGYQGYRQSAKKASGEIVNSLERTASPLPEPTNTLRALRIPGVMTAPPEGKVLQQGADSIFGKSSGFAQIADESGTPRPIENTQLEVGFQLGLDPKSEETKQAALLLLAQLRTEGVMVRNQIPTFFTTVQLGEWHGTVTTWMHNVIDALKIISEVDAELFSTLDTVPAARVEIPNIRLGSQDEREFFTSIFRQHDYRLVRLTDLLAKYGAGAPISKHG